MLESQTPLTTGIAPGAVVRVYAAGSLRWVDLDKALDRIMADLPTQPGMHQLSISLGLGETYMSKDEIAAEDTRFVRMGARGVNVFVSSGDAGSNPDDHGHFLTTAPLQVEFQSSDPFLVAVGGTTLNLNPADGQVSNEAGWPGSGGGISQIFQRPGWQRGVRVPPEQMRLVPDVSSAADPNTGAFLVLHGKMDDAWGGTSWSAPVWAGLCALRNESRAKDGKASLAFLNPLIYPLIGTSAFRDITSGSNGKYSAGAGFDMVTGLGVPNLKALLQALK